METRHRRVWPALRALVAGRLFPRTMFDDGATQDADRLLETKRRNFDRFLESIRQPDVAVANRPLQLFLEVTSRCNLLCQKCLKRYMTARPRERDLPFSFLQQLDDFYAAAAEVNVFGEGEMFLYRDLERLVRTLKKHGCRISGITNGMRTGRHDIAWLVDTQFDRLTFSIDAATAPTMRKLRGAELGRVAQVLEWLRDEKKAHASQFPQVIVNFVAEKDNIHELPELARALVSLDIYFLGVNVLHHAYGPVEDYPVEYRGLQGYLAFYQEHCLSNVPREDAEEAICQAAATAQEAGFGFGSYVDADFEWGQETGRYQRTEQLPPMYCLFPWTTLYLSADGGSRPCCYTYGDSTEIPSTDSESLRRAWQSGFLAEVRQRIREGKVHPACRPCVEHHRYRSHDDVLREIQGDLFPQGPIHSIANSGL